MTYDFLDTYWNYAIAIFAFIAGAFAYHRFSFNKSNPFWVEVSNAAVFVSFLVWILSFAAMTRLEMDALRGVFLSDKLPGRDVSFVFAAILFGVLFALIVIFYRNIFICAILVLIIGVSDIYGNQSMAKAMQIIQGKIIAGGQKIDSIEAIWIWYYLELPHPQRISIYMLLAGFSLIFYLISKLRSMKVEDIKAEFGRSSRDAIEVLRQNWVVFDISAKALLVIAVLLNEYLIYSWRYEREARLAEYGASIYFEFANDWEDLLDTMRGDFRDDMSITPAKPEPLPPEF